MPNLRIAEVFTSIQGEGQWVGVPSTFVRISGCNLRCRWCDTPYASWRPEGPVREVEDVLDEVTRRQVAHVVVTGGEPLLFDAVEPLLVGLRERGHVITIETAATVFRDVPCDLMSLSPKLANSAPDGEWHDRHESARRDRGPLQQLLAHYPEHQLKFVVDPEGPGDDLAEVESILAEVGPVDPRRVMLMAEGTDSPTLHRRERLLSPLAIARGWRLTPRFHIDLFGDTRGT